MKLERVIEEYEKKDDKHIARYVISLEANEILNLLDDLVLNEDDFPDEIYDPYFLTESQVKALLPFLNQPLHIDFGKRIYELMCYEVK